MALLAMEPSGCSAQQGPPAAAQTRQHGRPSKPNKVFKIFHPGPSENFPEKTFIVTSSWFPKEDPLLNQDAALEGALEKARDKVVGYLHEQKLGGEWTPKITFVRDRLLADLRPDEIIGHDPKGDLKEFLIRDHRMVEETRTVGEDGHETENRRVWVKVALNGDNWRQIQKEIRQVEDQGRLQVMRSRMVFLVKFLAGLVALFGTICGYLRLDEWSKGYYTKWLRLAAVGCVGAVTVFLWMLVAR
ncbi:MAG TPA: hypothetical protein VGX70_07095 [Gemmataceae bacterium]|jgi:hypothetical protein|nr:hypothetical protein [Gemmataceae bacterium]